MTVPTMTARLEAQQPLASQFATAQQQPAYLGALLRAWLNKEYKGQCRIQRGAMQGHEGISQTYEGLLLSHEAQPAVDTGDFVLVAPEAVAGIVQVAARQALVQQLEAWAKDITHLSLIPPLVLWAPHQAPSTFLAAWEQACQTPPLSLVVLGQQSALVYASASKQWHTVTTPSSRQAGPELAEMLALTRLGLMKKEAKLAWVKVAGCKTQPLAATASQQPAVAKPPAPNSPSPSTPRTSPPLNLHNPDEEGLFPLHRAALAGDLRQARQLLEQGATTETKDREGNTPLHLAVLHQNLKLAVLLLDFGADPNHRNYLHNTPLHLAAEKQAPPFIAQLIDKKAKTEIQNHRGMTPLHLAVRHGCIACTHSLVEAGANLQASMDRAVRPLHLAAWFGHVDLVAFLLKAGAAINAADAEGNTALHVAAYNGQVKTIKTLINHRADMQIRNRAGASYLNGISEGKQAEMVSFMEKK